MLYSIENYLINTDFYKNFLSNMPAPLDNIYFDSVAFLCLLIMLVYKTIDIIRQNSRHKIIMNKQNELKERQIQDQIDKIEQDKQIREQREEINQFLKYAEISLMSNSVKSFEEFKKIQAAEQMADNDMAVQAACAVQSDVINEETERLNEEIKRLQSEKEELVTEFKEKEAEFLKNNNTNELNELRASKNEMVNKLADKDEQIKNLNAELNNLKNSSEDNVKALKEQLAQTARQAQNDLNERELKIKALEEQLEVSDDAGLQEKIAEANRLNNKIVEEQKAELNKLTEQIKMLNENADKEAKAKAEAVKTINELRAQLSDAQNKASELDKANEIKSEEIAKLNEQLKNKPEDTEVQKQLDDLYQDIDSIEEEKQNTVSDIECINKEIKNVQDNIADTAKSMNDILAGFTPVKQVTKPTFGATVSDNEEEFNRLLRSNENLEAEKNKIKEKQKTENVNKSIEDIFASGFDEVTIKNQGKKKKLF